MATEYCKNKNPYCMELRKEGGMCSSCAREELLLENTELRAERDRLAGELEKAKQDARESADANGSLKRSLNDLEAQRSQLRADLAKAREEIAELLEEIVRNDGYPGIKQEDITSNKQHHDTQGQAIYDSMANSCVADAMCRLAELGRFVIVGDPGRRMFGYFNPAPRPGGEEEAK